MLGDIFDASTCWVPDSYRRGLTGVDGNAKHLDWSDRDVWVMFMLDTSPLLGAFPELAGIDLETAAPADVEVNEPSAGSIIEVGIVTPTGVVDTLVRPLPEAEHTYRTGSVETHGITWEMLDGAVSLQTATTRTRHALAGLVPVAHNARFERAWLAHHMGFDADLLIADTCTMAQRFLPDLPNHRLATVLGVFGIANHNPHRALSDARACVELAVALRQLGSAWHLLPDTATSDPHA